MKNPKRGICTSGSVRDEDGQPPHLLGRRKFLHLAADAAARSRPCRGPRARKRFNDLGHEVAPREQQTPEGLAAYYKAETDKWWPIIKAANIKAE